MSSWASFTVSTAAMLPVAPRTIVLPWSLRLLAPRSRSAGCIVVKSRPARYIGMVTGPTDGSDSDRPAVGVVFREGLRAIMTSLGTETPCAAVRGTASAGATSDDGGAAENGPGDFWPHRHAAGGCGDLHPRLRRAVVPSSAFLIPPPGAAPPSDYTNLIRTLGWTAVVSMDLAVSLTVMLAWVVGAARSDVPDAARRGIFIFATVFLAIWIIVGSPFPIFGRLL